MDNLIKKIKLWLNEHVSSEWYGINLKKATTWLVVGFIILLGFMLSVEAKAETTTIEFAPALSVASDRYNGGLLIIEERWKKKYAIGLGLTTSWECRDQNNCKRGNGKTNQFLYIQRIVSYKKLELGIGISYWHNKSPAWDSHTPFTLHIGWNFNKHANIKWRHFSTGGSSDINGGLDLLTFGWRY